MIVKEIPLLDDNYGYILMDVATKQAAVIDPVEPEKVMSAVNALGATVTTILTTHKHWDHASGNTAMGKLLPDVPVLGGAIDKVEACTRALQDGEEIMIGQGIKVDCLHTPGHTLGHICYYATNLDQHEDRAVFTGDTLFIGGAGKFFEGTPSEMYGSLYGKLATLPGNTKVYCGHEYTVANYKFAQWLEPENHALKKAASEAKEKREQGLPTIPSTIEQELATNPFLRVEQASLMTRLKAEQGATLSPIEALGLVREMKNNFKG